MPFPFYDTFLLPAQISSPYRTNYRYFCCCCSGLTSRSQTTTVSFKYSFKSNRSYNQVHYRISKPLHELIRTVNNLNQHYSKCGPSTRDSTWSDKNRTAVYKSNFMSVKSNIEKLGVVFFLLNLIFLLMFIVFYEIIALLQLKKNKLIFITDHLGSIALTHTLRSWTLLC